MSLQATVDEIARVLQTNNPTKADLKQCEATLEDVMTHDGDNPGLWFMMASVYLRMGRWAMAERWFKMTLEREPNMVEAMNNLGFALDNMGKREESLRMFRKAHKRRPDDAALTNNIATAYVNNGTPEKVLPLTEQAIAIDPDFVDAHWNRALALLELGQWEEGWKEHRWGLKLSGTSSQSRKVRHYVEKDATPWWEGTADKSVVIYSEQGVGDEILAASMLPDAARDAEVTFESHPRLVNIMRHSFGDQFAIYGTRKNNWRELAFPKWTKIDAKCAIFELGQFYRNKDEDFPRTPYLKPFDNFVDMYSEQLRALGDRPRIGIAWQGGSIPTRVDLRTIPLAQWAPIINSFDAEWVSLQYDPPEHPGVWAPIVDEFNRDKNLNVRHWEEDVNDLDLCYGGLIHALDLVITVNTSLVHACGAYGVPCWTLTPSKPAWRYGVKGDHIPWYGEHVRQIRQKGDDWTPVLHQVRSDLETWLDQRSAA